MTHVADVLANVTRLGLDTSPFIYFIENHPDYGGRVAAVFDAVSQGRAAGITSVISLIEVLSQPLRSGNTGLYVRYRDLLLNSEHLQVLPIESATAERAALLRAAYGLRVPDAIQVASAIEAHCDAFLTNDISLKRVKEIPVIVLGELESEP